MKNTSIIHPHFLKLSFWLFLLILTIFLSNGCQDSKTKPDKKETPITQHKLTDEEFEKKFGLKELLDKELKKIEEIYGNSYASQTDCCKPEGKVNFKFEKAYSGKFPYDAKTVRGMYVKLSIQPDKNCCKNIKIIQIKRSYTTGKKKPKTLPKWKVDGPGNSPYATDYNFASEGKNGKAATVLDIPGRNLDRKNLRVEYMTVVLCTDAGKKDKPLAYVHWGFDISENSEIKPITPEAHCSTPKGMKSAVTTWNNGAKVVKDRIKANIDFP